MGKFRERTHWHKATCGTFFLGHRIAGGSAKKKEEDER